MTDTVLSPVAVYRVSPSRTIETLLRCSSDPEEARLAELVIRERTIVDGRETYAEVSMPLAAAGPLLHFREIATKSKAVTKKAKRR